MPLRCRADAWKPFSEILDFEVTLTVFDDLYNLNCVVVNTPPLYESSPSFDAANILRANDDVLYLV